MFIEMISDHVLDLIFKSISLLVQKVIWSCSEIDVQSNEQFIDGFYSYIRDGPMSYIFKRYSIFHDQKPFRYTSVVLNSATINISHASMLHPC